MGRIYSGLTVSVAHLHLAEDLLQGRIPPGEEVVQQRSNIGTAQQWSGLLVKPALFQSEQHGHHDQCHMMMPAAPAPDLIVARPDVLCALLQGAFDPVALPLHEGQAGCLRVGRGVAEANGMVRPAPSTSPKRAQ